MAHRLHRRMTDTTFDSARSLEALEPSLSPKSIYLLRRTASDTIPENKVERERSMRKPAFRDASTGRSRGDARLQNWSRGPSKVYCFTDIRPDVARSPPSPKHTKPSPARRSSTDLPPLGDLQSTDGFGRSSPLRRPTSVFLTPKTLMKSGSKRLLNLGRSNRGFAYTAGKEISEKNNPTECRRPTQVNIDGMLVVRKDQARILEQTLQLLFSCEVLVVTEFVKVLVPLMLGLLLAALRTLPSARYSILLRDISSEEIVERMLWCLCFSLFELPALVIVCVAVFKKYGISPVHLLAFLLEQQYANFQTKLVSCFIALVFSTSVHQVTTKIPPYPFRKYKYQVNKKKIPPTGSILRATKENKAPSTTANSLLLMMRGHDTASVETEAADPLAGQPTDQYGVPLSVVHSPQTDLPVWQYIHQLATPLPNSKSPERPHTHICILCSASPPLRPSGKKTFTWRNALMRQRMSTNAVSHLQRVHPDEFVSIADYKQRKRQVLEEKAAAKAHEPKKKRAKSSTGPKRKTVRTQAEEAQGAVEADATPVATLVVKTQSSGVSTKTPTSARKRAVGKTVGLLKSWLVSSGLPVSMLQDETFQQLMKLSTSAKVAMPSASNLNVQVQDEFAKFGGFLRSYLAAESQAAMGLPFLTLRHEFRPISAATAEDGAGVDVTSNQEKAFLSVAVGFVDSQWRRVDLALAAKEVPRGWNQQISQLVTRTVSETYNIDSISNYARFHADADEDTPSTLAASGEYEPFTDEQEDLLTRTLRRCVIEALGIGRDTSFGGETAVRRILRLLQELVKYFETPDRAVALVEISAAHNVQAPLCSASSIDELALSTYTSIGALAELLRVSCTRYHAYSLYFQSPVRPTAAEPELETAWMQLSMDDWRTAAEIEAALNQLAQFRLEERLVPRPGAVAPSYALLFRRLLGVTIQATSLKCLLLEDSSSSTANRAGRRKTKRVDTFTPAGQQCIMRLRELITQRLPAPSTPSAVDDEIKAMLLDPRISSKAANLVTDTRAFRRAQEALRQEHRVVFELIAGRSTDANANAEEEDEDEDEDDDEISALLMVDGPKNQPPAARSPANNGRRSSSAVAEDEERAWREWQQVYVAWDTHATEGADLFDKGQYNLLKLYHHVNILKWFREVGQQAYPAASLLARMYLGRQPGPSHALGASLLRFTEQEDADWVSDAVQRAEKRCILHHNWYQYQQLSANAALFNASEGNISVDTV